jgi:hypothetical protein
MGIWLALLVGAALAPTDAALGAGLMVNPAVPARIRRLINVESGLNDGIATPVVPVAVAHPPCVLTIRMAYRASARWTWPGGSSPRRLPGPAAMAQCPRSRFPARNSGTS